MADLQSSTEATLHEELARLRGSLLTEAEKDALLRAAGEGMKYIAGPGVLTLTVGAFNKLAGQPRAAGPTDG